MILIFAFKVMEGQDYVAIWKIKYLFVYVLNTNLPSILYDFHNIEHFVIFQLWPLKVRDFSWSCPS